jgi:hypothetical protein
MHVEELIGQCISMYPFVRFWQAVSSWPFFVNKRANFSIYRTRSTGHKYLLIVLILRPESKVDPG